MDIKKEIADEFNKINDSDLPELLNLVIDFKEKAANDCAAYDWLSPVKNERETQEKRLKEILPSYPSGYEKWQYLNRLIDLFPSAVSRADL